MSDQRYLKKLKLEFLLLFPKEKSN